MSDYATPEEHAADVQAFTGALAAYADSHEANCTRAEAEAMESGPLRWECVRTITLSWECEADSRADALELAAAYFEPFVTVRGNGASVETEAHRING